MSTEGYVPLHHLGKPNEVLTFRNCIELRSILDDEPYACSDRDFNALFNRDFLLSDVLLIRQSQPGNYST